MSALPISSKAELARFFLDAFKPLDDWRMGVEFEKLGVDPATGRAIPFSGPNGVEQILAKLSEQFGWTPHSTEGRLMEFERETPASPWSPVHRSS